MSTECWPSDNEYDRGRGKGTQVGKGQYWAGRHGSSVNGLHIGRVKGIKFPSLQKYTDPLDTVSSFLAWLPQQG